MNWDKLRARLASGRPGYSLAAYRILFGLLLCGGSIRFMANGWIDKLYGEPSYFFPYWGFEWVPMPSVTGAYAVYCGIAVSALLVALGLFYRIAIVAFTLLFFYAQLWDVTNYLNHYYLVVLLGMLLCFAPASRCWSIDAWRKNSTTHDIPAFWIYLLRFQIACVYFFAGLAKLQSDWLLHAQPLNLWLSARSEMPIIGPLMDERWFAYFCSWAGFLFDTTIVAWLSWRRTRVWAYLVVVVFHAYTHVLFDIGLFPFIMIINATMFFAPTWPLALARRLRIGRVRQAEQTESTQTHSPLPKPILWLAGIYCLIQVLVPLRHYAYPGNVLWNEDGMRYAWKVMVREKHGSITYQVRASTLPRAVNVSPRKYLSSRQEREMSSQPDLIATLARRIAKDFEKRGHKDVAVFVDSWVSLNGRPAARLIDPTINLAAAPDDLSPRSWVLPMPKHDPIALRPLQ